MQDKRVLYERSVAQYGVRKSINKCIEEMAELIIELARYESDRLNMDKIAEEMAHVAITTEKLVYYWGMIEEVEQEKDKTLEHLRLLLEDKSKEESRWRKKDG
jgi:type II secretory pathway predicted ATPase ExeA